MSYRVINGDSAKELKKFTDNTIDAVITDPPYGIEFLAKEWDSNTGAVEIWQECLRVLKPGGHLLAFSAARTYHHLATNIESAGFEIRDQIMWLYASGFPKAQQIPTHPGWRTGLKPAHEPIVMARKPLQGSCKANMATHGVGALNIDASRIPYEDAGEINPCIPRAGRRTASFSFGHKETHAGGDGSPEFVANDRGRFPANVVGEVAGYQKYFYCPKVSRKERSIGCDDLPQNHIETSTGSHGGRNGTWYCGDCGKQIVKHVNHSECDQTIDRVWRESRPQGNNHPTVKPVKLMRYLIRLVAPQGAHIIDPFSGSGSTGMACRELGIKFTGIELDPNYCRIARQRIAATHTDPKHTLFE